MEQQDYLKRQIDQIGRILGQILTDLAGFKNKGQINDGIELTNQTLKNELDINITELAEIRNEDFITTLKSKKNLTNENIGMFAEILLLVAESSHDVNRSLYEKCLIIYEYLEKEENVYSLDRQWKIKRIKNVLA